jgi:hypothetical protein
MIKLNIDLYQANNTKDKYFVINGEKVKDNNYVMFEDIKNILNHLGYEVELNLYEQDEEVKLETPMEYFMRNLWNIFTISQIDELTVEQTQAINKLAGEVKKMEKGAIAP